MLVLIAKDAGYFHFHPGIARESMSIEGFTLHRVSKVAALAEILPRRPVSRFLSALSFLLQIPSSGLSDATSRMYEKYVLRLLPSSHSGFYSEWVSLFDDDARPQLEAEPFSSSSAAPLISLLLPVFNTTEKWLRCCIESVRSQLYQNWELCISDDASHNEATRDILREYALLDSRIKFVFRNNNGHISASSNSALGLATGEYVALLDHDDELRPHALLEVAKAIVDNPSLGLIYSDEDKIDADGRRFHPYFKPDWNPDLLRSQNYVCHLTTLRTDLVREVGGFREGFEGSQDHDLLLRCTERLAPEQIHHVPKILYHWRAVEGSTALARGAKDYAADAGARAVAEHLVRIGSAAVVEQLPHGHYRVRWPLPDPPPKVSLIVPTRNKIELLRKCVESILTRTMYPVFEIVVVDNQSDDPDALEYLSELEFRSRVRILRYNAPFNYSAINNWAVEQCDGSVIGLVNNDVEVITPGWLDELVSHASRPDVGAVGAMLYYPNDSIQHAGVILGIHGVAAHLYSGQPKGYPGHGARALVAQELSAVTGACLFVRKCIYQQVGGLDESLRVAFNDIDFCLRLKAAGHRNIWSPFAELYHHESATRGHEDTDEKKARFSNEVALMQERWGRLLPNDPAYNPNLSLESLVCDYAFPPRREVGVVDSD